MKIKLSFFFTLTYLFLSVLHAEEIKIGATLHFSGDLAMQSAAFREGIELATERVNTKGINGNTLKVIFEDGHNTAKMSNTASRKLVYNDKVSGSILSSYFDVMSSGPIYEKEKIPAIALWDSSPEIDNVGDYIFGIGPWTPSSGSVASDFAIDKLNSKTAIIVSNTDSWSEYVANVFAKQFTKNGGKILKKFSSDHTESDYKSIVTVIKNLKPDVIYSPITSNITTFYKRLKEFSIKSDVITSDVVAEEHIKQSPNSFEGIYQTNLADPSSKSFDNLKEMYRKKYKKEITLGWFVSIGYDAIMIFAEAIKKADSSSVKIQKELYKIKNFKGVSSTFTINEKGSSPQYPSMFHLIQGKFVKLEK